MTGLWPIPSDDQGPAVCRLFWLPSGDLWEGIARGALDNLCVPDNWRGYDDTLTPDEVAATYEPLLEKTYEKWHGTWNAMTQKILRLYSAGLIAYWPLWEALGATRARDFSGNAYHGTPTGGTWEAAGIGDGMTGIDLSGSSSRINLYNAGIGNLFKGNAGSYSLWANADTWLNEVGYLFRANNFVDFQLWGHVKVGLIDWYMKSPNPGGEYYYEWTIPGGFTGWHNIAMTWDFDANNVSAYLDGVLLDTTSHPGDFGANTFNALVAGALSTGGTVSFDGKLAHIALWDHALSAEEIAHVSIVQN